MRIVQAIDKYRSAQNDLVNRRCTILQDEANNRPDGQPMTQERVIAYIKEFDSSTVVDLNKQDIPVFLYNKDGKFK